MSWVVYILECRDKTLYTGITNNLENRISTHENGKGAKYTKGRGPFTVVYKEKCTSRSEATKREIFIKKLTKTEKISLFNYRKN